MQGTREERAKEKRKAEFDDNDGGGDDALTGRKKKKKKKQKVEHGGEVSGTEETLGTTRDEDLKEDSELAGQKGKEKKRKEGKNKEQMVSDESIVENSKGNGTGLVAEEGGKKKKKKNREKKDNFVVTDGNEMECDIEKLDENAEGTEKKTKKKKKMGGDSEAEGSTANKHCGSTVDDETTQQDKRATGGVENSRKEGKKKKKDKKKPSDLGAENHAAGESTRKEEGYGGDQRDGKLVENFDSSDDGTNKKMKKKKSNDDSGPKEDTKKSNKAVRRKHKKKKQNDDSGAEEKFAESNGDTKKKEKQSENVEDETPSLSKSAKKVKFSDQVEVFPISDGLDAEDKDDDNDEEEEEEDGLVRGKRFLKEEDEMVKNAVLEYIETHGLGENGIDMIMQCKSHPEVKNCWKEIGAAIPWRPRDSIYYRAHILFEGDSKKSWTAEEYEFVKRFAEKHGSDWRTLADAVGKHRLHVKDAWRRLRFPKMNGAKWSREEYQTLFDLVNSDLRMKAFEEKKSKHGMLRDNIPWSAISDKLGTRNHSICCMKWYNQLTSPMVAEGTWDNADDYRLLNELLRLDASCIEDVDWDNLLENRSGDVCRKRWSQMVLHIGQPESKSFSDQVEILANRYCPQLAEAREEFDDRPAVS